jgi:hypothetical protein
MMYKAKNLLLHENTFRIMPLFFSLPRGLGYILGTVYLHTGSPGILSQVVQLQIQIRQPCVTITPIPPTRLRDRVLHGLPFNIREQAEDAGDESRGKHPRHLVRTDSVLPDQVNRKLA